MPTDEDAITPCEKCGRVHAPLLSCAEAAPENDGGIPRRVEKVLALCDVFVNTVEMAERHEEDVFEALGMGAMSNDEREVRLRSLHNACRVILALLNRLPPTEENDDR